MSKVFEVRTKSMVKGGPGSTIQYLPQLEQFQSLPREAGEAQRLVCMQSHAPIREWTDVYSVLKADVDPSACLRLH
jgi:hypothetical protein